MIKLDLTPELYGNLRILVVAGAKSPQTDEMAIMAAAELLVKMAEAFNAAQQAQAKTNGHDAEPVQISQASPA